MKEPIPCKDCISMAMCNSRAHSLRYVFNTSAIISNLYSQCSILRQYFLDNDTSTDDDLALRNHPLGKQLLEVFTLSPNIYDQDGVN